MTTDMTTGMASEEGPSPAFLKTYKKYCKSCALAKYNVLNGVNKLFRQSGTLNKQEFSELIEFRKVLEAIDNEAAALGFLEMRKNEEVTDVMDC